MQPRTTGRAPGLTILVGLIALGLTACVVPASEPVADDHVDTDTSAPTTQTVMMRDPVGNAFTIEVPEGWDSIAYSSGGFDVHHDVVSTVSPDGKTVLFIGDPKLPMYWDTVGVGGIIQQYVDAIEVYETKAHQAADIYFPEYVTRKFGELPGFEISNVVPENVFEQRMLALIEEAGVSYTVTTAEVHFSYQTSSGDVIQALVAGWSMRTDGVWTTDMMGLATDRNADDYRPMLHSMLESLQPTAEYTAATKANQEKVMAQIKAYSEEVARQHNQNMAWIQQSAAAHQSRMDAIWSPQGDASMQNYYNRMDSMDRIQRDFLNYINEEETVSGGLTGTRQVTSGATNYWVNKNDGTYVGGDINFGDAELRRIGLNPGDYEQVTVVR
ncbi:MAG: hypothetical protein IT190_06975 [Microbacteriaceae bacterium]|nr:hypothetical protein [Microbacteriaceae bacterium]